MEDIFKVKQGDTELLREFVDRFQRERMMLPQVTDNWTVMAFASNLNEKSSEATRRLKESLREFLATKWNDVYNRYEPYMGPAGRDSRSKQENIWSNPRSRHKDAGSSSRFRNGRDARGSDSDTDTRIGDYSFNVSTFELVAVLRSMGDKVRWPKEMRSNPSKRNSDFWYEFHNDHGHKTTDCRLLQGEVEHLLKQGYLTDLFSEKGKQSYMKNRQEPPKPPSPKRTVNVISGGEEVNGVIYTAAKKTSKVTITHGKRVRHVLDEDIITFDDADADGLLIPHNDALVISLLVHDTNVKQVLIDPSSSINIILLRVVNEM
ncbi:uncharacterized protein [Nicotiana tomentosiformis]|uniref:uncharacterized protein n=1 Tax=Nicotiana tomentosiformis TaxID=4098 RepID=UPI00388CE2C8